MPRIIVIRKSLAAFVCGLFGFLPFIGLVPALFALLAWVHIHRRYPNEWNPAEAYLSWGARLALLGLLGTVLVTAAAIVSSFG